MTQTAEQIRDLLRSQGKSDEEIDKGLSDIEARFNGTLKSQDFKMWLVAVHIFKIQLPRISAPQPSTRQAHEPPTPLKAKDVNYALAKASKGKEFAMVGWVLDPGRGVTLNQNARLRMTLVDETGSVPLAVYGDNIRDWDHHDLKLPAYLRLERVELLAFGSDGYVVTWGRFGNVAAMPNPPSLESMLPDALSSYIADSQVCRVKGFVTDERRKPFQSCVKCRKSMKGGLRCATCGCSESEQVEFHSVTVTDGGARISVALPPELAPGRDLYGHPLEAVLRYSARNQEFVALTASVAGEQRFKKPREVLTAAQVGVDPRTVDTLNRYVRVFRRSPKDAVLKVLQDTHNMKPEEAQEQVARALKQQMVREEGPYLVWAEQRQAIVEPQTVRKAAPAEDDRAKARSLLMLVKRLEQDPQYKTGVPFDVLAGASKMEQAECDAIIAVLLKEGVVHEPVLCRLRST